ncbi:hypothetical protein MMC30_004961 [Trapelia coarctata]|nr:hypothetical protein [Trapelia coarctata]
MGQETSPIPVIDISEPSDQTGHELVDAAARYGFVFIKSKSVGFTADVIDQMFALSRKFFHSPDEEKESCRIGVENAGWSAMHSEVLDPEHQERGDYKEAFNFKAFKDSKAQQPIPKSLEPNETQISHFYDLCHQLCIKLLELFAIGLKIDPSQGGSTWFSSRHDPSKSPSGTVLRILYYPTPTSSSPSTKSIRAGAHSDYGTLTLLFRLPHQAGLEILAPTSPSNPTESWVPVPVLPPGTESDPFPPILVNIADLLSHWTGGLLKSTVHRVVFPTATEGNSAEGANGELANGSTRISDGEVVNGHTERGSGDRYSIAFFLHPNRDTPLVPIPSPLIQSRGKPAGNGTGKVMTANEHLMGRLAATYGWGKEDVEARRELDGEV